MAKADTPAQTRVITEATVPDLTTGVELLGSGGGGETELASIMLARLLRDTEGVPLVSPSALPPDAWAFAVATTGSITVMIERLPSGTELVQSVQAMERQLGVTASAVYAMEVGGINGLMPVAAAALLGLPVLDVDGEGRAFPRLDQTVFALAGLAGSPAVLVDITGNEAVLRATSNSGLEQLARAALPALGGWAATTLYPMTAAQVSRHGINGSVSGAIRLGQQWRAAAALPPPARARQFTTATGGAVVFTGTVVEVRQRPRGVLTTGSVTIEHQQSAERTLRVDMADEYLLLLDDGEPIAQVPDIICLLDARSWRPISTEHVVGGQQVDVLVLPAPAAWSAPGAADLVGLPGFGLDAPVVW